MTEYEFLTPRLSNLILEKMDTVISAPPELYSCAQNRPSAASETPGRAHPGASGPFPPATHTLGTLWPAGLAGGDLWWSPAAVPQAKDAISVWLSSVLGSAGALRVTLVTSAGIRGTGWGPGVSSRTIMACSRGGKRQNKKSSKRYKKLPS